MNTLTTGKKPKNPFGKSFPQLIGNHRMMRLYLDGFEGTVECDFVMFPDIMKVTTDRRGRLISDIVKKVSKKS